MIGVYNHLLRKEFRFHCHSQKVIGSLGIWKTVPNKFHSAIYLSSLFNLVVGWWKPTWLELKGWFTVTSNHREWRGHGLNHLVEDSYPKIQLVSKLMFPTQLFLIDGEEKKTSVAFATNVLEDGRETPILLAEQPAKPQTGVGQHVSRSVCQSHVFLHVLSVPISQWKCPVLVKGGR